MDHAQVLEPINVARLPTPSRGDVARSRLRRLSRTGAALQALSIANLLLVGAGGYFVARRAQAVEGAAHEHSTLALQQTTQLRAVTDQSDQIRAELEKLRLAVVSHNSEESLYLKSLILRPDLDPGLARSIAGHTRRYCELFGRDPNLVLAIMSVESNFEPRVVSGAGAVGLMQVMPQWKKVLHISGELTDPETSIRSGLQILAFYQEMYRDLSLVLTAYNRGPGSVDAALRRGEKPDNGYAPRVLATYERLRRIDTAAQR